MEARKVDFNSSNVKAIVKKVTDKARSKSLIKPLSDAFKDVPVKEEVYKGDLDYFYKLGGNYDKNISK